MQLLCYNKYITTKLRLHMCFEKMHIADIFNHYYLHALILISSARLLSTFVEL